MPCSFSRCLSRTHGYKRREIILTKFNIITDKVTQCCVLYYDTINTVNILELTKTVCAINYK